MDGSVGLISTRVSSLPVLRPITTGPEASKQQTAAAKTEDKNKQDERGRTADAVAVANTLAEFLDKRTSFAYDERINQANTLAKFLDKKVSFAYDERINQVVVKIIRESTQEVIRQIPPEEMVELMARLREDFRGLIFNQTS